MLKGVERFGTIRRHEDPMEFMNNNPDTLEVSSFEYHHNRPEYVQIMNGGRIPYGLWRRIRVLPLDRRS